MNVFFANIFSMIRFSLGDNDFDALVYMTEAQNIVFWILYLVIAFIMVIVFLNFIIAEASAAYETVQENLDEVT